MRKIMLTLASFLLGSQIMASGCCDPCCGWPAASAGCITDWPSPINVNFGGGYRQDKFHWSIAGLNDYPNVLSQLSWKNLRIAQIGGDATYVSCRNYAIRIDAQYGQIYHGRVSDRDWLSDDRNDLFSFSSHDAGRGRVYDLSAAAGYRVTSTCFRFIAIPLIGYSQHAQYLHILDGRQVFPICYRIRNVDSTYHTRWYGPWIGVHFESRVERCAFLLGGFEWHMLSYRAEGKWNLRPDLSKFHHKAYGFGFLATLGGKWEIWNRWAIEIRGTYRNFRTRHGHEHVTLCEPGIGCCPVTLTFNQAKWRAYTVSGIIAWRF